MVVLPHQLDQAGELSDVDLDHFVRDELRVLLLATSLRKIDLPVLLAEAEAPFQVV